MILIETFDTHIKAISTAKQWNRYKAMAKQPTLAELDKRYIEEILNTEWERPKVITLNEDNTMKYRVTSNRHPFDKGTEFELDDSIEGIAFSTAFDELPRIGNGYLNKYPNDFEPVEEVQEGDYYRDNDGNVLRVNNVKDGRVDATFVGDGYDTDLTIEFLTGVGRKLSTHEIDQAITKEAKRRGLLKNGTKVATLASDATVPGSIYDHVIPKEYHKLCYNPDCDQLEMHLSSEFGDWIRLYKKGNWAEIIDQTPHIEINGKTINVEDGTVKISCGDTIEEEMFKNFYAVVNKYDLDVRRNGEQINEQLQQIWHGVNKNTDPETGKDRIEKNRIRELSWLIKTIEDMQDE